MLLLLLRVKRADDDDDDGACLLLVALLLDISCCLLLADRVGERERGWLVVGCGCCEQEKSERGDYWVEEERVRSKGVETERVPMLCKGYID